MKISLAALAVAAVAVLTASSAFGHRSASWCSGAQLAGRFAVVYGSAGAGNITYKLTLRNSSSTPCTVSGLPAGQLLGLAKQMLPTHVRAAHPNQLTAILVTLVPGASTSATARFSPDVTGTGDHTSGACQPKAYWFLVRAPGGGTTAAKLAQPTPVCERGTLSFSAYAN
jgi:hypothetical protein